MSGRSPYDDSVESRLDQIEEVLVELVRDLDEQQVPRRRTYDWALERIRVRVGNAEGNQ